MAHRRNSPLDLSSARVLLVDKCQATRDVRAAIFRAHGIVVHAAEDFPEAHYWWQPGLFDLVLLDVRRYPPDEILEFCEQIKDAAPGERIAFIMGPPNFLS